MTGTDTTRRSTADAGTAPISWRPPALRAASLLSALTATLLAVASAAGLLIEGAYGRPVATASMLRGFDLVNLLVAVPALVWSLLAARGGSLRGRLVWLGSLAYVVYTYAYYLFGTGFNDLFLLHVAVFSCSLFALVLAMATVNAATLAEAFSARRSGAVVSGLLGMLALGLGAMWVFHALRSAATGDVPAGSGLVETGALVHLGIALDLAVLVPAYGLAAVLLWRHSGWGLVLAALVLVSGVGHQVSYLVAMPFQVAANVPGAAAYDPAEPVVAALFVGATVLLLAGVRADVTPPQDRRGRDTQLAMHHPT